MVTVMENDSAIYSSPLFEKIPRAEIDKILGCANVSVKKYRRGEYILHSEDAQRRIGVLLSGSACIAKNDSDGNRVIMSALEKDEIFGTAMAVSGLLDEVYICAEDDCTAMLIDAQKLLWGCDKHCFSHSCLTYNLISLLTQKNMKLIRKLGYISRRTLRDKVIAFLCDEQKRSGKSDFYISFDRQGMADYLAADRSALSAELSRMKRQGLIDYRKNHFILKSTLSETRI